MIERTLHTGDHNQLKIVLRLLNFYDKPFTIMIQLPPDFLDFLRLLNLHKVEYLLIGGYAVAYHGYVRATGDGRRAT